MRYLCVFTLLLTKIIFSLSESELSIKQLLKNGNKVTEDMDQSEKKRNLGDAKNDIMDTANQGIDLSILAQMSNDDLIKLLPDNFIGFKETDKGVIGIDPISKSELGLITPNPADDGIQPIVGWSKTENSGFRVYFVGKDAKVKTINLTANDLVSLLKGEAVSTDALVESQSFMGIPGGIYSPITNYRLGMWPGMMNYGGFGYPFNAGFYNGSGFGSGNESTTFYQHNNNVMDNFARNGGYISMGGYPNMFW